MLVDPALNRPSFRGHVNMRTMRVTDSVEVVHLDERVLLDLHPGCEESERR